MASFVISLVPSALLLDNHNTNCMDKTAERDLAKCTDLTVAACVEYHSIITRFHRYKCIKDYTEIDIYILIAECKKFIDDYQDSAALRPAWKKVSKYYSILQYKEYSHTKHNVPEGDEQIFAMYKQYIDNAFTKVVIAGIIIIILVIIQAVACYKCRRSNKVVPSKLSVV